MGPPTRLRQASGIAAAKILFVRSARWSEMAAGLLRGTQQDYRSDASFFFVRSWHSFADLSKDCGAIPGVNVNGVWHKAYSGEIVSLQTMLSE
jgi:hypothetical protein